jgi:hypothetical protein
MLHERKLCGRSRSSEWCFVSICCVYSVSIYNIVTYRSFVISDLKIIDNGNPDNNLESPCISSNFIMITQLRTSLTDDDALSFV